MYGLTGHERRHMVELSDNVKIYENILSCCKLNNWYLKISIINNEGIL
jgi:hypothetical protein